MSAISNRIGSIIHNPVIVITVALISMIPLVCAQVSVRNPTLGAALLETGAILLLAVQIAKANWSAGVFRRAFSFLSSEINLPVVLFLVVGAASLTSSPSLVMGAQELLRFAAGATIYFAIAHHARRSAALDAIAGTLLIACIAVPLIGFAQYRESGAGAGGPFGDHQLFGSFMLAILPVAAALAFETFTRANSAAPTPFSRPLVVTAATVFAAAGLLVSECRSAWAGAVVALATLAACWLLTGKRHDATRSGSARIAIAPALLVLSSVGFLFAIWPHATILDRAATVATPATYSAGGAESSSGTKCCSQRSVGGDSSWHGRKLAWAGAMRMIRQEPWTGNGLGSYPVLQSRYAGVGLDIGPLRIRPSLANQAHSLYLQMAAEIGIPGLLIFLAIPVTILGQALRQASLLNPGPRRSLMLGAAAGVIGCLVDALASPSWQMASVSPMLWVLLGIVAAAARPHGHREPATATRGAQNTGVRAGAAFASLGLCSLLPTAAMAADPAYMHICSCRVRPSMTLLDSQAAQSQTYQFLALFCDANGNVVDPREVDITNDPGTKFSFTTNAGNVGRLKGPNNSVYESQDIDENYQGMIKVTFTDGFGGKCSDTAQFAVKSGDVSTFDSTASGLAAAGGGLILGVFLAHHASTDSIDDDAGGGANAQVSGAPGIGFDSFGQALPADSPFRASGADGRAQDRTADP
ncbi:MAG TPA: O-antigen ligase family protein [Chthonomonadaceae bacterium]|nr:O-antigen ligase family protein [Chthonomonadaceae bacterium]